MFKYPFTKAYNLEKLNQEIMAAGIPMISMDLPSSTQFIVNTNNQLTNLQQLTLNSVVEAHNSSIDLLTIVTNKIYNARLFGIRLMCKYGAQNVLSGYNVDTIQHIMTRTAKVQAALNTGSLYVAITEINLVEPDDTIITVAKLKAVRNEIEDYLQIPRT